MKLFNLFSRKKKLSIKSIFEPVLDKMWVCAINFCPWNSDMHDVVFKKVGIKNASADKEGIYVVSDFHDPFTSVVCSSDYLCGYIDKITVRGRICGFFETEELAKKAYNELMNKWIDVIKSKMEPYEHQ